MQKYIDINSDAGESFGAYRIGNDEEVFKYITSATIACGFHAGDPSIMRYSVLLAKKHGVGIGPHPGLPDLLGFGRRMIDITPKEAADYTVYQIGALQAFAKAEDMYLSHVKFHGFFYELLAKDKKLADPAVEAILKVDENLILFARPGTELEQSAKRMGLKCAHELAIDRARRSDGGAVSRREPNAVTTDPLEVADRAKMIIKEGKLRAIDGKEINVGTFDSFCVHGDNPNALEILRTLNARLAEIGVKVKSLKDFSKY